MSDVLQQEIAPGASLTLRGKEYRLAFPIKAVIAYKQETGQSLYDTRNWANIDPKLNPEFFLAALYAAVITHHPDVTKDDLAEMVDFSNSSAIEKSLVDTLMSYFPKPEASENSENPEQTETVK